VAFSTRILVTNSREVRVITVEISFSLMLRQKIRDNSTQDTVSSTQRSGYSCLQPVSRVRYGIRCYYYDIDTNKKILSDVSFRFCYRAYMKMINVKKSLYAYIGYIVYLNSRILCQIGMKNCTSHRSLPISFRKKRR
jgi:hypothetical protein